METSPGAGMFPSSFHLLGRNQNAAPQDKPLTFVKTNITIPRQPPKPSSPPKKENRWAHLRA